MGVNLFQYKTGGERLNISEYESNLEGILTSVPSPFQVRSRSVPKNGSYLGLTWELLGY